MSHLEATQDRLDRIQLDYNREVEFNRQARHEHSSMRGQLDMVKSIMVSTHL